MRAGLADGVFVPTVGASLPSFASPVSRCRGARTDGWCGDDNAVSMGCPVECWLARFASPLRQVPQPHATRARQHRQCGDILTAARRSPRASEWLGSEQHTVWRDRSLVPSWPSTSRRPLLVVVGPQQGSMSAPIRSGPEAYSRFTLVNRWRSRFSDSDGRVRTGIRLAKLRS